MEPEPPGAASFCLEPEPTQVGRSRSRLWDLGHQWRLSNTGGKYDFLTYYVLYNIGTNPFLCFCTVTSYLAKPVKKLLILLF